MNVYVSFSHEDEILAQKLFRLLRILDNEGLSSTRFSLDLRPSPASESERAADLEKSNVFLALVSPAYVASLSSRWTSSELKIAQNLSMRIVPILLKGVVSNPLTAYQMLPPNGVPLTQWPSEDIALDDSERASDALRHST